MKTRVKLAALAVGAVLGTPSVALAQSSVEVYGTINMAFGKFKYSESSAVGGSLPSISKWDVSQGASNYGLRGREGLGGGLTAWFQIEQNAPMERSNNIAITPASRNSAVGIQGGFGNIFLGQWTTPWADLDALWGIGTVGYWGPVTSIIGRRETTGTAPNANCVNAPGGSGSPSVAAAGAAPTCDSVEGANGVGHAFWRRASQAVVYHSPVFSGAQVKVLYQTNDQKTVTGVAADPSMLSSAVQWSGMGGRARVGVAFDRHKDFTTIGNTDTGWALKGGFNFGVVDIGAAFERMTYKCGGVGTTAGSFNPSFFTNAATCLAGEGDVRAKQWGVAAAVPVGTGAIRGSYSRAADLESSPTTGTRADTGAKQWNVGYEHRFSKRSNVGVGYAKIDNKDRAAFTWTGAPPTQGASPSNVPAAGSDPSTWFVSITHRF